LQQYDENQLTQVSIAKHGNSPSHMALPTFARQQVTLSSNKCTRNKFLRALCNLEWL